MTERNRIRELLLARGASPNNAERLAIMTRSECIRELAIVSCITEKFVDRATAEWMVDADRDHRIEVTMLVLGIPRWRAEARVGTELGKIPCCGQEDRDTWAPEYARHRIAELLAIHEG